MNHASIPRCSSVRYRPLSSLPAMRLAKHFFVLICAVLLWSCAAPGENYPGSKSAGQSGNQRSSDAYSYGSTENSTGNSEQAAAGAGEAAAQPASKPTLRSMFRQTYDEAIDHHQETTILGAPLIIQDLLNMTLVKTDGERVRYEMDKSVYFALADNTHPPYGIYSIIALQGYGALSAYQLSRLAQYRVAIQDSLGELDSVGVDANTRERLRTILVASSDFIDEISAAGSVSQTRFETFIVPLRPLFYANFELAALEQLRQFRAQMGVFRSQYAEENWADLRVVVMGFHQPRKLWVLKQFFQWLLSEPDYEHRVVYAEFQHSFFGPNRAKAEALAIELATKVDFDISAAQVFVDDKTALGSDILGPYARDMIKTWGPSDFIFGKDDANSGSAGR